MRLVALGDHWPSLILRFAGFIFWKLTLSISFVSHYRIANPRVIESTSSYRGGLAHSSYISLGTNLLVTITLVFRLWRGKRVTERLLGNTGNQLIPYSKLITVLLQSALPPLLLGISHLVANVGYNKTYVTHGTLWVSFTVSKYAPLSLSVQLTNASRSLRLRLLRKVQ